MGDEGSECENTLTNKQIVARIRIPSFHANGNRFEKDLANGNEKATICSAHFFRALSSNHAQRTNVTRAARTMEGGLAEVARLDRNSREISENLKANLPNRPLAEDGFLPDFCGIIAIES